MNDKGHRYIRVSIMSRDSPTHVMATFKLVYSFKTWPDREGVEWHETKTGSIVLPVEDWLELAPHLRESGVFKYIDESKTVVKVLRGLCAKTVLEIFSGP